MIDLAQGGKDKIPPSTYYQFVYLQADKVIDSKRVVCCLFFSLSFTLTLMKHQKEEYLQKNDQT